MSSHPNITPKPPPPPLLVLVIAHQFVV